MANIIEINLLPSEHKQTKLNLTWVFDSRIIWATFALLAIGSVLFLLYYHSVETTNDLRKAVDQTKAAVEKERPLLNQIKELEESLKGIEQKSNALRSIQVSRKRWVILFEDLSTALSPGTWITGITQNGDRMDMTCATWNFPEVALYMLRLEQRESVTNVTLTSISATKVGSEDAYTFSLSIGFNSNLGMETGVR